jgi:hypothetical protein
MKKKFEQKDNKDEGLLDDQLSKDFVVKNMPSLSRLSSINYETQKGQAAKEMDLQNIDSVGNNSKNTSYRKTGIIIVSSGLIFIAILFYLAYRFLITPFLQDEAAFTVNETSVASNEVSMNAEMESSSEDQAADNTIQPVDIINASIDNTGLQDKANFLVLPSILDSDGDGLSDVAESFLGTDPYKSDTDGDGYSDKDEILSGYNPLGTGLLTDNRNLSIFIDSAKQYAVIYPQAWEVNMLNGSVLFAAPDQDFIQVSYEDNGSFYASIIDWYEDQFSDVDVLTPDRFVLSSFGPGIISADQQFVYFLDSNGTRVFVISYIPAGSTLSYLEIFKMMIATFMKV